MTTPENKAERIELQLIGEAADTCVLQILNLSLQVYLQVCISQLGPQTCFQSTMQPDQRRLRNMNSRSDAKDALDHPKLHASPLRIMSSPVVLSSQTFHRGCISVRASPRSHGPQIAVLDLLLSASMLPGSLDSDKSPGPVAFSNPEPPSGSYLL